jgi:hypothetical protein
MNAKDYRFFRTSNSTYPVLSSIAGKGLYFTVFGTCYDNIPSNNYSIEYYKSRGQENLFQEIPLSEALKIIAVQGRKKFLNKLEILNPDIKVTNEDKKNIINKLTEARAFNEDSAMEMENIDICFSLKEKGLIKEYNNRFFVNLEIKMGQIELPGITD